MLGLPRLVKYRKNYIFTSESKKNYLSTQIRNEVG